MSLNGAKQNETVNSNSKAAKRNLPETKNNKEKTMHQKYGVSERHQMIEMSAYYRAEKRGFDPAHDLANWFESESEIDGHLISSSS